MLAGLGVNSPVRNRTVMRRPFPELAHPIMQAPLAGVGADALVVQGAEAGGHRGSFADRDGQGEIGLLALLRLIARRTDLDLVASGGIVDGAGVAAALAAGARAAQIGTGGPDRNRVPAREHTPAAPAAYPEIHHLTAPLRAAARAAGDADAVDLWAGQAYELAGETPAAQLVRRLERGGRCRPRQRPRTPGRGLRAGTSLPRTGCSGQRFSPR
jgi:nitronate monooxygenase